MSHKTEKDHYAILETGRTLDTRRGTKPEYRLVRNGTTVATGTLSQLSRERAKWEAGWNPYRNLNGELRGR